MQATPTDHLVDAAWSHARIDDAGHWLAHEQPEAFATIVLEWLTQETA